MQFSRAGDAAPVGRSALQEVRRFVAANPANDHSVATLAKRMNLSPRHFARLFHNEVGLTPAAWVEATRIAAARRLLEGRLHTPKQAATLCAFTDADTLRRAFARTIGRHPPNTASDTPAGRSPVPSRLAAR
jgi:transcriptional regulator GlxA family with amidase domain